jgi:glyoxylase-like metal-dependent hydrolase (beta-lactamase superfamily II)
MDASARARLQFFDDAPACALPAPYAAFGDGFDLFGDGSVRIVSLPGHAAGHVGLLFADGRGDVLLIADAAWSSAAVRDGVSPPALVTGWLGDTATYRATIAKLHALRLAAPELRIVPSHCREWRPAAQAARELQPPRPLAGLP